MSKLRRAATLALCGLVSVLFTVWTASPAQAWTWNRGVTVHNGAICVQGDAGIDHVTPGVFSANLAYANTYARSAGCGAAVSGLWAAVRLDVYRWNGSAGVLCRNTDWTYGYTGADQWGPTGPGQVFDYGGAWCGSGWYQTVASSYVAYGGVWLGGGVQSGWEFVP